jgi:hypothetical protein
MAETTARLRHAAAAGAGALLVVAAALLAGAYGGAPASLLTYWTAPAVEPRWGPPVVSAPAWLSTAQYMRAAAGRRLAFTASMPAAQTGWSPYAAVQPMASWSPYAAVQPAVSWSPYAAAKPSGMQLAPQASWSPYGPAVVHAVAAPMVSSVSSSQARAAAVAISAAEGNAAIAARAQAPWLAPSAMQGPVLPSAAPPFFAAPLPQYVGGAPLRQSYFSAAPLFGSTRAVGAPAVLPGLPAMSSIAPPAPFGMHAVAGMPGASPFAPPGMQPVPQTSWSPYGAAVVHAVVAPGVAVSTSHVAPPFALAPGEVISCHFHAHLQFVTCHDLLQKFAAHLPPLSWCESSPYSSSSHNTCQSYETWYVNVPSNPAPKSQPLIVEP